MRQPFLLTDAAHQVERLPDRLGRSVGDKCSAPRVRFHQALLAQRLDCLPHCRAAHAEVLGQLAFCGQLIAGFQRALEDRLLDLLNDLLVKTGCPNGFVHGFVPKGSERLIGHSPSTWLEAGEASPTITKQMTLWSSCHTTLPNTAVPCKLTSKFSLNPHSLNIRELPNAMNTQFAAISGLFHATERNPRVRSDHLVDENHPCF